MPRSHVTLEERLARDGYPGVPPVLFYRPTDAYGFFSNFSPHYVTMAHPWIDGTSMTYLTGEHAFQAAKATSWADHDHVASAKTPYVAKERGGPRGIALRDAWDQGLSFEVMKTVVLAKTMCHVEIYLALVGTQQQRIYEDSPVDDIWDGVTETATPARTSWAVLGWLPGRRSPVGTGRWLSMTDIRGSRMTAIHADEGTPGPRRTILARDVDDGHTIQVTFPSTWSAEEIAELLHLDYRPVVET